MPKRKKSTNRCFVLDTSVILYSSRSLFSFGSKEVIIPLTVLDELDTFKASSTELGRNARTAIRDLYELSSLGDLSTGVSINDVGGKIRTVASSGIASSMNEQNADNKILGVCEELSKEFESVVLITKDLCLAIKAKGLGVESQDFFEDSKVKNLDELYTGAAEIDVAEDDVNGLYSNKCVQFDCENMCPNQFVIARSVVNSKHTALARVSQDAMSLNLVEKKSAWNISPRNLQQIFAMDLLLDDSISLVTLSGIAGTGKSLLSIVAGLQKVVEEKKYDSLIITRPTVIVGKNDLGFLPGSMEEKFEPWVRPIRDIVGLLFGAKGANSSHFDDFVDSGVIRIEPIQYVRGRSFHNNFILLDESQNLTKHEIKTFLTRTGENTKVVLTGDPGQIDTQYIDSISNGLTQVIEKFRDEPISGHVTLFKGERSLLATLAANLL